MLGRGRSRKSLVAAAAALAIACVALGGAALSDSAAAKGGKPSGGETATNNLSFPVIFPEGKPSTWVEIPTWIFAQVTTLDNCVTEAGVPTGTAVPANFLCYYARQNLGVDEETGQRVWVGDPGSEVAWWLQERAQNKWQVYDPVVPATVASVPVTAVDIGDLLESLTNIKQKQVRTEFSLLQVVDDTLLGALGAQRWSVGLFPDFGWANQPVFGALKMSGAVPGTDKSINEIQGTDYGPGPAAGQLTGTGTMIDPDTVKTDSVTGQGFDALVYSLGARLVIQKVTGDAGTLTWSAAENEWTGAFGAPIVDISAGAGTYTPEINAGGSIVYGYNWNTTKAAGTGLYRLTFVLDSGYSGLKTVFDASTALANPGNANTGHVVAGSTVGEGGLAYVDVNITVGGGGGGGGGGGKGGR